MYVNPMAQVLADAGRGQRRLTRDEERAMQESFEDFYLDVWEEVGKVGLVEDVYVCDNLGDHLVGSYGGGG